MLYEILKAAHDHPTWRSSLVPLVKLAKLDEKTRRASCVPKLRDAVIRTAFEATDQALRRTLVEIVQRHDATTRTASLSDAQRSALIRLAYKTTDADRRQKILGLLHVAKYSESFKRFVENKKFPNPNPENREAYPEVKFFSLPPAEQKRVYDEWKVDRKENAQQHKPEGLSKDTKLTPEKFDALEVGDVLWLSYSPKKLHKVTGFNKTKGGKPVLEMVQIDRDNPEKEGEKRYLHRSGVDNEDHEFHVVPKAGGEKPKEEDAPEKAEAPESEKESPKSEKPKDEEKPKAEEPKAKKAPVTHVKSLDDFNVGDVFFEDGFPDHPIKLKKILEDENGDFKAFVAEDGLRYYKDEIHKGDDGYARVVRDQEQPDAKEEEADEAPEKAEAPKVEGKHKDRKELLGKKPGVTKTTKMHLDDEIVELAAPEGMSADAAAEHRKRMKDLDVADARDLIARLKLAVGEPEGKRMKALESVGYTHENVKKLHDEVAKRLRKISDHVYGKEVLNVANKYDLEAEDADELRDFKGDKPGAGRKLPDAELMQKFMQKAKPETRERMKGMNIADFMAMYNAIMAEEDEGAE